MPAVPPAARRLAPYAGAAAILALVAALTRASSWRQPLGTDTGQYLYVADVLLDGDAPYADAATNKGPVTYLLFGAIRLVAGTSMTAVRLSLLVFAVLAALALGLYVARYAGRAAGALAALVFALFAGTPVLQGEDPNTEQYGIAFAVGALWAATRRGTGWALGAGALLAAAMLVNPTFAIVLPFVALELWRTRDVERGDRPARIGLAAAGLLAVSVPVLGWLAAIGAFDEFWDSVVVFAFDAATAFSFSSTYVPVSVNPGGGDGLFNVSAPALWIWGLAGAALACTDPRLRRAALPAALWAVLVWLRVKAPNYEFAHHYYPALPALVIGIVLGITRLWALVSSPHVWPRVAIAVVVLAFPLWKFVVVPQRDRFEVPASKRWGIDNYALAYPVADFLKRETRPDDRILVVGTDPEVYWLAERRAITPMFDIFGMRSSKKGPERRFADFRRSPPAAIVAMPDAEAADPDLDDFLNKMGEEYPPGFELRGARVWLRKR